MVGRYLDPEALVDRELEAAELRALLSAGAPKLALLTGRRRVGKTWLLTHIWPPNQYFLFTASRTSPELNRRQLLADLERFTGQDLPAEDFPTWRTVFNLLLDLKTSEPLAVVLDEFQYLAEDDAGLARVASELNAAWERPRPPKPFLMVLAGSAVGTMRGLAAGGAPLYGRFNWQHQLAPLDYWYAGELAPYESLRDRATVYGVFGGTPRYLSTLATSEPLESNIIRQLLSPRGEVRLLVETALDQEEGLRDVSTYNAILRAVARGATLRNEIAQQAGLTNDTGLRDKLDRLVGLGYLRSSRNIGAKVNSPVRYGVNDPALRFYQRFVQPNSSALEREDPALVWAEAIRNSLPSYMGFEFESIVRQAYGRLGLVHELPIVKEWGTWQGMDRAGRGLEIDVVAPLLSSGTLTGSIKWNETPIGADVHYAHLDMLTRAAHAGQAWAHSALEEGSPLLYAAAGGFDPSFAKYAKGSGKRVILWTLEDLYAPA